MTLVNIVYLVNNDSSCDNMMNETTSLYSGELQEKKINVLVKECFGAVLPEPVEGMRDRWAG
jgi:hypothetical protein